MFDKKCRICGSSFQDKSRNKRYCFSCTPVYKPKERKYCEVVDESFFREWTSNMAYIVGFIAADGAIQKRHKSSLVLKILSSDRDIIEKIGEILSLRTRTWVNKRENTKTIYYLNSSNGRFINPLLDIGIGSRKSYEMKSLSIPDKFFWDFLRGYSDGDGSIQISPKVSLSWSSASYEYLEWLRRSIARLLPEATSQAKVKERSRKPGNWTLHYWCSTANLLLTRMYSGKLLSMERKAEKVNSLLGDAWFRQSGE